MTYQKAKKTVETLTKVVSMIDRHGYDAIKGVYTDLPSEAEVREILRENTVDVVQADANAVALLGEAETNRGMPFNIAERIHAQEVIMENIDELKGIYSYITDSVAPRMAARTRLMQKNLIFADIERRLVAKIEGYVMPTKFKENEAEVHRIATQTMGSHFAVIDALSTVGLLSAPRHSSATGSGADTSAKKRCSVQ